MNYTLTVSNYDFNLKKVNLDISNKLFRDVIKIYNENIFFSIEIEEIKNFIKIIIDKNNCIDKERVKQTIAIFSKNVDTYLYDYSNKFYKILPMQSYSVFYKLANIIIFNINENYDELSILINILIKKLLEQDNIDYQKEKILKNIIFLFNHIKGVSKTQFESNTTFSIIDIILDNCN